MRALSLDKGFGFYGVADNSGPWEHYAMTELCRPFGPGTGQYCRYQENINDRTGETLWKAVTDEVAPTVLETAPTGLGSFLVFVCKG
jgi:hypothetical protein